MMWRHCKSVRATKSFSERLCDVETKVKIVVINTIISGIENNLLVVLSDKKG